MRATQATPRGTGLKTGHYTPWRRTGLRVGHYIVWCGTVSWYETLGYGEWAAEAEGARGDFETGGGLFALVFVAID